MDIVDFDLREAERDASPDTFRQIPEYMGTPGEYPFTTFPSTKDEQQPEDLDLHPLELNRIQLHRLQHKSTVGENGRTLSRISTEPLPGFGAKKPFPPALPDREEYVVEFLGRDDPLHPHNWPMRKKYVDK